MTVAIAHPNIALIKYWGKQPGPGNLPATPSLSVTLEGMRTVTSVESGAVDTLVLNGVESTDAKIAQFLALLRQHFDIPPIRIDTSNDFPTGAGLASSASGFAALMTAINAHCDLQLSTASISGLARQGSASAARSIFGGFVSLGAPTWEAAEEFDEAHWPLTVLVAVTSDVQKHTSSTQGMIISANTSPYFKAWTETAEEDFHAAREAVRQKDFAALATVAEHSSMKMHALMLSSQPPLIYWNAGSLEALAKIRELRSAGVDVFATMDAGPQVKAVCTQSAAADVSDALSALPSILRVVHARLGPGATTLAV